MLSFLYVYSDHSILECYDLFSGVELSMRSFFVIWFQSVASTMALEPYSGHFGIIQKAGISKEAGIT